MRKKWFKKLGAAFCAALLSISCLNLTAFAAGETIEVFTNKDYQTLAGLADSVTTGTINVTKKISAVDGTDDWNDGIAVRGVELAVAKVGQYATVTSGGTTGTMIGISQGLVEAVWPKASNTEKYSGMILDNGYYYMKSGLYNTFNEDLQDAGSGLDVSAYTNGAAKVKTDDNGVAAFTGLGFGIYLIAETDVDEAQIKDGDAWKNQLFSKKQYPYLVSLPYSQGEGNWSTTVEARAKNEADTVQSDKKIERYSNTLTGKRDNQFASDVTHIGDTVEFTLITDVPTLEAHASVESYVITDEISAGFTLPEKFSSSNITITDSQGQSYIYGTDYTVTPTPGASDSLYANTVTITFKDDAEGEGQGQGLKKISNLAHGADGQEVYVSYIVTVNENAIIGTAGNPNRVKLNLSAAGSGDIETSWATVKEFIFKMEGNKTFNGSQNDTLATNVKFQLYLDEACTKGVNLTVGTDGQYVYNGEGQATEISLTNSKFAVKGVPVTNENSSQSVTLYLKETATADGYNKLMKVVPIELTAATIAGDEYSGELSQGTVNGQNATLINSNTTVSFTVDNTEGFSLPQTGGMGIWMFVIAGILVIAAGIFYYKKSKKRA